MLPDVWMHTERTLEVKLTVALTSVQARDVETGSITEDNVATLFDATSLSDALMYTFGV